MTDKLEVNDWWEKFHILIPFFLVSIYWIGYCYFNKRIESSIIPISEKCGVNIDAFSMSIIILAIETRYACSI
jgi:hypothetical protein